MSPSRLTVEVWPVTDTGQAVDHNEDFVAVYHPHDPNESRFSGSLYIVADGLGGGTQGELASRYAVQKVMHEYYNSNEPDLGLRLQEAVGTANLDLWNYAQQRPELVKLGTTIVAAVIRGEQAHIAAVGNSRAYLIREGQIAQVTHDHTVAQQLLDEGAITPAQAREHPRRDVVLRSLGAEETLTVDIFDLRLRPDDSLLLCTDGLTRHLHDDEVAQIVASSSPRAAAEMLVQKANDRGGKDNVTVVTALVRDGAPPLEENIPHTWDGQRPTFDDQPTLTMPRADLPEPAPPELQEPLPAEQDTMVSRQTPPLQRPVTPEAAPIGTSLPPAEAPPAPMAEPTPPPPPPQPVQPPASPPYAYGAPSAPPPQAPAPGPSYPQPPYGQPAAPQDQGYGVPPQGYYPIDPVTGLPPVPPSQQQWPGQPGPTATPYAPRIYQPPAQPHLRSQRQGVPLRLVVFAGILAVVLTAVMVLALVNPFDWQLPFGSRGGAAAEGAALPTATPLGEVPETTVPEVVPTEVPVSPTSLPPIAPPGMVLIEGGPFLRGVGEEEAQAAALSCIDEAEDNTACFPEYFGDAQPVEEVTLNAFFIDVTEITNAAFAACVAAEVCAPPDNTEFYADPAFAQHPAVYVTWNQAGAYCQWAGKRLPTEAEWEKAARWDPATGQSYTYPWGNDWEPGRANTDAAGLGGTTAVQAFAQDISPWGALGMGGNVSEWVQDWYYPGYEGLGTLNPTGPDAQPLTEPFRVARGGNFQSLAAYSRAGQRYDINPTQPSSWIGFRCAASVDEAPAVAPPADATTPVPEEEVPAGEGAEATTPSEAITPEVEETPIP